MAHEYSDDNSEDDQTPESLLSLDLEVKDSDQSFVLGYSSTATDLASLHPLPSQIQFYWQTFVDNVDPLMKIMHIPTMHKTIREAQENIGCLERSTEVLMFAIYMGAVTSMTAEQVRTNLNMDKTVLLKRYRFATEQALARANFLVSSEIVTLQAFVLFLVCVRTHDDSRAIWSLTGLMIRLAQSIGLHQDGQPLGLSVFETEMRRRLWWQIRMLDIRAAEDFATDPTITEISSDTQMPLNINDTDLNVTSETYPKRRTGLSDMTFSLIRYEIGNIATKLSQKQPTRSGQTTVKQMTLADKEKFVVFLHEHLQGNFSR